MILTEVSAPSATAIPVHAFGQHLRLGSGFSDDGSEDAVLELYLRAAMAAIEARLGFALLARVFSWTITRWRHDSSQGLPIGPVQSVDEIALISADGSETLAAPSDWHLLQDASRPRLLGAQGHNLPSIPRAGHAEVRFTAGYGKTWEDVPNDLRQAVFLLAAHYYEHRNDSSTSREMMPFGVLVLIESYRSMRIGGRA